MSSHDTPLHQACWHTPPPGRTLKRTQALIQTPKPRTSRASTTKWHGGGAHIHISLALYMTVACLHLPRLADRLPRTSASISSYVAPLLLAHIIEHQSFPLKVGPWWKPSHRSLHGTIIDLRRGLRPAQFVTSYASSRTPVITKGDASANDDAEIADGTLQRPRSPRASDGQRPK